ncbi:MAG: M24 family metallopeptidase [Bdellovibrionota bacterium]|nr:M24 family metallopeptidase [Bdellovibrionota bacterium]
MGYASGEFSWKEYLKEKNIDGFYLPSFDNYLSEYVPKEDSLRIFLTQFTGSVAEALVTSDGMINLYVDGRYHEQADLECDLNRIRVVKVPFGQSIGSALGADLKKLKTVGFLAFRTPEKLRQDYNSLEWSSLNEEEFHSLIGFSAPQFSGDLWEVPYEKEGEHLLKKWQRALKDGEGAFLSGLDAVAWASGLRSNSLPYQGTFRALALLTNKKIQLFVDPSMLEKVQAHATAVREVYPLSDFNEEIKNFVVDTLWWDPGFSTAAQVDLLKSADQLKGKLKEKNFHSEWMSYKSEPEKEAFRTSFEKSNQAIYDTFCALIERVRAGEKISEVAFRDSLEKRYQELGARTQSFRTIAGFGAHGSIIHYGTPKESTYCEEGDLVLCDSGAIYEEGFATDCTRTVLALGAPNEKQRTQYTLVLKGLLQVLMARFKEGIEGNELDKLARAGLKEKGMDFAHGTGHGVGVNVHEGGYSIRPESVTPMKAHRVGSIEPGFYEPGVGGIRLENIAIVQRDEHSEELYFEDLVTIGFWLPLVERTLLSEAENKFLDDYEARCLEKGRSFAHLF